MADISDIANGFQYSASIKDGKVTSTYSKVDKNTGKIESDKSSEVAGGALDKEAFLQLLVAQMKYQDPMEPTDNTEYISQLANFSSLEQMQNMNDSLANMSLASDLQRASNLVGNFASVDVNGQTITGKVDTVEYKDGTAYLSIEGKKYPLSSLKESIDATFLTAQTLAEQFDKVLSTLPDVDMLTQTDEAKIENLRAAYDVMDMYQQSFISKDSLAKFNIYEQKVAENKAAREEANKAEETTEETAKVTE